MVYTTHCKEESSFLPRLKSKLSAKTPSQICSSNDLGLLAFLLYRISLCRNAPLVLPKRSSIRLSCLQSTRKRQNSALSQIHGPLHRTTLLIPFFRSRIANSLFTYNSIRVKTLTSTSVNWKKSCGFPQVLQDLLHQLSECLP